MQLGASEHHRQSWKFCRRMSRRTNCWDNAVRKSFFGSLKQALADPTFRSHAEARAVLFEYLEIFYNRPRLHSPLRYMTPAEFQGSSASTATCPR